MQSNVDPFASNFSANGADNHLAFAQQKQVIDELLALLIECSFTDEGEAVGYLRVLALNSEDFIALTHLQVIDMVIESLGLTRANPKPELEVKTSLRKSADVKLED